MQTQAGGCHFSSPALSSVALSSPALCTAAREVITPIGRFWLAASANGLMQLACELAPSTLRELTLTASEQDIHAANTHLDDACGQLEAYLAGRRQAFSLALAPKGTEFQRAVWQQLMAIPFGDTQSYSQIATAIGRPKAVRAVGAANGANPIAIIVPCHRVIGKNGTLTGYAWGLEMKSALLALESAR